MEAAIGIISLSVQLIDSAVKVKRVIGTYRSASTEVNRLALKVERVEAICGAIKESFEGDMSGRQCSDLIKTWGVCVLRSIESTLAELHGIVTKLERRASQKRALHTVGFSFLEKKADIQRLGTCLDEDLNYLQHMMTAEIFSRCGVVEQLILPLQSTQIVLPKAHVSSLSETTPDSTGLIDHHSPITIEKSHRQTVHNIGFVGDIKTTMVKKKSRWRQSDEPVNVSESKTYSFGLRGFAYRILFSWKMDEVTPVSYALNVQHIIAEEIDRTRFQKVTSVIRNGDLSGLQQMLITREVTLTSFIACMTLFEYAVVFYQPEICHFLARQNLRQCLGEDLCRPPPGLFISYGSKFFDEQSVLFRVDNVFLSMGISATTRMKWLPEFELEPKCFFPYYQRIRACEIDGTEREAFLNAAWDASIATFLNDAWKPSCWLSDEWSMSMWTSVFGTLIAEGVDAHRACSYGGIPHLMDQSKCCRTLRLLLHFSNCHRKVEASLTRWVRILQAAGVNVPEYLHCEKIDYEKYLAAPKPALFKGVWSKVLGSTTVDGFEVPIWHRWVEPASPAYEVRHEFRDFGRLSDVFGYGLSWYTMAENTTTQHIMWKTYPPWIADKEWPYVYSPARDNEYDTMVQSAYPSSGPQDEKLAGFRESFYYAKELVQKRSERRRIRKLYKSGYHQKEKRLQMPGAWKGSEW